MDDADRIAVIERRLVLLEDEAEIRHLFVRYGLAVDIGDVEATIALYTEDCHVDIDGVNIMIGREQARNMVEHPLHQGLLPFCAHVMGPFDIRVDGDLALAIGYATVFTKGEESRQVWRQSFGRWELVRSDGRWLIARRVSRSVGHAEAPGIAVEALA